MAVAFTCPHCHRPGKAADAAAGRPVRCRACQQTLTVPYAPAPGPIQVNVEAPESPDTNILGVFFGAIRVAFWLVAAGLWIWLAVRVFLDQPRTVEDAARFVVIFIAACFAFVIARCIDGVTRG